MFIIIGEYQRQKKEYTSVNKKKEKSICENIIYETTNTHTHTNELSHTKTNKKRTLTWYCNSASLIRINALLLLDVVVGTTLVVDTAAAVAVLVRGTAAAYDCCRCGWDLDDDDDDDGVPAKSENDISSFPY